MTLGTKRPLSTVGIPVALVATIVGILWALGHETLALVLLAVLCTILVLVGLRTLRSLEEQLADNEFVMLHDALTELPNRLLFHDRVHQAILAATRGGTRTAVIVLDVDRFKEINDALGHHMGDLLLHELGNRLKDTLRRSDSVARLGGDEFAILLPRIEGELDALAAAEKIRGALTDPVTVRDLHLEIEASAGIAVYPDHGPDPDTLLQHADVAMYNAKRAQSGCELYAATRHEFSPSRLRLVQDLRSGIGAGQIELHYQPKIRLSDGRVVGVEALARWNHPERGLITPDNFIPLAEHTGLIRPLTLAVLETALDQCAAWRSRGIELGMAVNLSPRNLVDHELPHQIKRMLDERGLSTRMLELELTEDTIMSDPQRAREILARLDEMGIGLAIDDFGTGYSSLAYLRQLPVSTLKVDRSFVTSMGDQEDDAVIVRSTIALGSNLGLSVVAEGVETAAVMDDLRGLGCDEVQGFYVSRPVPARALEEWLLERELNRTTV
ncbi:MAG TPA: EAL domain-containing protein [Thermoleophilaceae bacterium]